MAIALVGVGRLYENLLAVRWGDGDGIVVCMIMILATNRLMLGS